jgi:drug/metabolite transporter (DMT)-like permease
MKSLRFVGLVLLPVTMTTVGEFVLKHFINIAHQTGGVIWQSFPIWVAITMITWGGILWLVAMSKYELSFIYPFLSINYISIVVGSQWVLGEEVSWVRYLSVIFIVVGLILISRSPNSEAESKDLPL